MRCQKDKDKVQMHMRPTLQCEGDDDINQTDGSVLIDGRGCSRQKLQGGDWSPWGCQKPKDVHEGTLVQS